MKMSRCWILFLAVLSALAAAPAEKPISLRVGAAREDITPDVTVRNWVTGKTYDNVLDPLYVHVLVIDDGRTKAAIIRWDLVDVSESARDEVRKVVGGALSIPGENILINASHTHSAPWAPVYSGGQRGRERDTWWALRYMPTQNAYPPFRKWMDRILAASEQAARRAAAGARPADMLIGRVAVSEFLNNRRPRAPAWGLAEPRPTPIVNYSHKDWNPDVLQGGAVFGPMDRTLTLVAFRDPQAATIATLFHVACHAVSIYPSNPGISADWPGAASARLSAVFGGESMFLQGNAGDINPWRRGAAAVAEMAEGLAKKSQAAMRFAVKLSPGPLTFGRSTVELPLMPAARERTGTDRVIAEVQVVVCGPLAFVTLPGEPLTALGVQIRERSPFPQTIVLGYSNGNGVHYVGLPGEKARGGYEAGVAGAGEDAAGQLLVETAVNLLQDVMRRSGAPDSP